MQKSFICQQCKSELQDTWLGCKHSESCKLCTYVEGLQHGDYFQPHGLDDPRSGSSLMTVKSTTQKVFTQKNLIHKIPAFHLAHLCSAFPLGSLSGNFQCILENCSFLLCNLPKINWNVLANFNWIKWALDATSCLSLGRHTHSPHSRDIAIFLHSKF